MGTGSVSTSPASPSLGAAREAIASPSPPRDVPAPKDDGVATRGEPLRISCFTDLAAIDQARTHGALQAWEDLVAQDPSATFYQGPIWTLSWYRAYRSLFTPLLIVLHDDKGLAGLAPMAVELRTERLAFAGDNLSDYRDVVSRPEHREALLRALVRVYRARQPRHVLRIGSTLPDSPTAALLMRVSREEAVPALRSSHDGWRWWPDKNVDPFKSRSARYKLNCVKRRGEVELSLIASKQEWIDCREAFYLHHTLRQIYRGTVVSYDKPEKRAFSDALVETPLTHVTVLRAGGEPIAWHFGYRDKGLIYWGAPAFDVRDHRYSPSLLLMLFMMRRLGEWGIRGLDLTIGHGELKERNSTDQVELPTVQLFRDRVAYLRPRFFQLGSAAAKRLASMLGREELWKRRLRPGLQELRVVLDDARQMAPRHALRHLRAKLVQPVLGHGHAIAFVASSTDLRARLARETSPTGELGWNAPADLLKCDYDERYTLSRLRAAITALAEGTENGFGDFHTWLEDGRLQGWGFSRSLDKAGPCSVDGLIIPAGAAMLWGMERLDDSRGALGGLVRQVAARRIAEGATSVWLLATTAEPELHAIATGLGFVRHTVGTSEAGHGAAQHA